jgi:hypothetical protein
MKANEFVTEKWSQKYKNSINCSHPKGFSQRAHCAGKKKHNEDVTMEQVCPDCGMCQTHGNLNEIRKGQKDANGYTRCWPGKHAEGTKRGKNGGQVRNCVPNESINELDVNTLKSYADKRGAQVAAMKADNPKPVAGSKEWIQQAVPAQKVARAGQKIARKERQQGVAEGYNGNVKDTELKNVDPDNHSRGEGEFVKNQLHTMKRVITHLDNAISRGEDLPDWVQSEIAQAADKIVGVMDYSISSKEQDIEKRHGGSALMKEDADLSNLTPSEIKGIGMMIRDGHDIPTIIRIFDNKPTAEQIVAIHQQSQGVAEEFDLIESIIEDLAASNGVDSEVIWEDLESLDDDELYVFATTSTIMETISESRGGNYEQMGYRKSDKDKFVLLDRTLDSVILTTNNFAEAKKEAIEWAEYDDIRTEVIQQDTGKRVFTVDGYAGAEKYLDESEAWQKANNRDRTNGMSRKAVKAYRREHPGSKLQTAVTTKPSKLKKGSKASKRRKSYCSRSRGQMKMHNISCAKTPDKAICKARRRWNC